MRKLIQFIHVLLLLCPGLLFAAAPQNPLLQGDELFVSAQGVFKFDLQTRQQLWSSLVGVETYAPVSADKLILVGSTQGLYALNSDDGKIAWHIEQQRSIFSPLIATQAYAGSLHGRLYSIDPSNGQIHWQRQFPGWIYSPQIDTATGVLWSGGQAHEIYALDGVSGNVLKRFPSTQELVFSPEKLDARHLAFNFFDGSSMIIHSSGSEIMGLIKGQSQPKNIAAYGEFIYRADRDGSLLAFHRDSLALAWRRQLVARNLGMHPAQPGYLLMSDLDQNLILFDLQKNKETWRFRPQGRWVAPIQISDRKILYFESLMNPPWLVAVQPLVQY